MIKTKYFIIGLILGIGMISFGAFATITGGGTIGSLFEKVGNVYRLVGDNIKDNTIDSSEIEDYSITINDLALNSVGSGNIINNSISSNITEWTTLGNICDGLSCISYCLNGSGYIVGMKWINKGGNYDECFNIESGSLIKVIRYYK